MSAAQDWHVHNAREARRQALADGAARPSVRLETPAPEDLEDFPGCDFYSAADRRRAEVLGYLASSVIPWRHLTDDEVTSATRDRRPTVAKRARREAHRRQARANVRAGRATHV